ncbi:MAG TPA: glycosyltransferase family 39 protein, partial [Vicinamibacterales bacterium]|nr:glycosyltransferase family 39 protein [Vicinamibacterales bacterium]
MNRDVRLKADTTVPAAVAAACVLSFAIGLVFLFVRAPHPWGWNGFDHYHELALALASGQPFPTMEVPWGYAYFLSFFYRLFGDHPWIPLLVQVSLNALTPLLLFALASRWTDTRTATVAAVLLGTLSFNTVYASTQSSDAICTVLFLTAVLVFVRALDNERRTWFALAGVITGVMSQFRPNLILIPGVLAAFALWKMPSRRRVVDALILLVCAGATLMPWIVRNYRLTKSIVPTSVHGGAQLWYGSLQVGPYLDSRGYNPRSIFESPAFQYTSLSGVPILVHGGVSTCAIDDRGGDLSLFYWTDFAPERRKATRVALNRDTGRFTFELPPPDTATAT